VYVRSRACRRDIQQPPTEALDAFQAEPEQRVDVSSLMVAAQQVDVLGVLNLQALVGQ
jgi:hypothetical protein